jgi:hypothetical protein
MRLNLNFVNAHLVYQLEASGGITAIKHNSFDVLIVELPTGEMLSIHLVERDIDVGLIKSTLEYNAQHNQATLFILWTPMLLPEDGERYRPYDWMHALITLYDDKIYGYEVYDNTLYVFPVHFDRPAVGIDRIVRYGDRVEMGWLHIDRIRTDSQHLTGFWRIGDFEPLRRPQRDSTPSDNPDSEDAPPPPTIDPSRNELRVFYAVLGVSLDADWETIRRAYRQLALQYHPDVNKTPEAHARMQQINTAYQRISEILDEPS